MPETVKLATTSSEEKEQLAHVLHEMSDIGRWHTYADWLAVQDEQCQKRSAFLKNVLAAWESDAEELPYDQSIDSVWQNTSGITVLRHLRRGKLHEQSTHILQAVRPAIRISPQIANEDVPVGASKFGGLPDLPPDVEWPDYQQSPQMFLGQLNLEELQATVSANDLPKNGLIAFFAHDDQEEGETAGCGDPAASSVIHINDVSRLSQREADQNSNVEVSPECILIFEETLDLPYISYYDAKNNSAGQGGERATKMGLLTEEAADAYEELLEELLPEREESSHLLGWSHPQVASDDVVDEGFRHLLSVASEESLHWCWGDGHVLYFSVPDEGFANRKYEQATAIDG